MRVRERGLPTPERQRDRVRLGARDPEVERLVQGLDVENLDALRAFCKALMRERNRHDIARRGSGLFHAGRIPLADADRQLRRALAALEGGAE